MNFYDALTPKFMNLRFVKVGFNARLINLLKEEMIWLDNPQGSFVSFSWYFILACGSVGRNDCSYYDVNEEVIQFLYRPWGFQEVEDPEFQDNRHMEVARLSGNISGIHLCRRLSRPQDRNAAGRIMLMTNSSDAIGNRIRDVPTCSAVPQPTAPPRAPYYNVRILIRSLILCNTVSGSVCRKLGMETIYSIWRIYSTKNSFLASHANHVGLWTLVVLGISTTVFF
jgi:hypothetical protein